MVSPLCAVEITLMDNPWTFFVKVSSRQPRRREYPSGFSKAFLGQTYLSTHVNFLGWSRSVEFVSLVSRPVKFGHRGSELHCPQDTLHPRYHAGDEVYLGETFLFAEYTSLGFIGYTTRKFARIREKNGTYFNAQSDVSWSAFKRGCERHS